jgi:hypothetical protein
MSNDKPFHVYANQTQRQAERSNSASLSGQNQVSGFEPKDCDEGTCSTAPVSLNQSEIFEWLDRANVGDFQIKKYPIVFMAGGREQEEKIVLIR